MRKSRTKKSRQTSKSSNKSLIIGGIVLSTVLVILAIFAGYKLGETRTKTELESKYKSIKDENDRLISKMKAMLSNQNKSVDSYEISNKSKNVSVFDLAEINKKIEDIKLVKNTQIHSEVQDYEESKAILPPPPKEEVKSKKDKIDKDFVYKDVQKDKKIKPKAYSGKPKLAIIIDDVANEHQVKMFNSLNMPISLSFFPTSSGGENTPKLAKKQKFAMIHLPMEAVNFKNGDSKTLKVGDSFEKIDNRLKELQKEFPTIKYLNNHTGSKFTSDLNSMRKFLKSAKNRGFVFVDSKTSPNSKVDEVAKELNINVLSRDVFLDNKQDVNYIKNQIKEAVLKSKKNGSAIAIGHPHPATAKAIYLSKKLLDEVKLVYVNELN